MATMTSLIVGCGYLGTRMAQRLIARGDVVYATAREPAAAETLNQLGVRALIADVTQPVTLTALNPIADEPVDVYYLVPRRAAADGPANVIRALDINNVHKAVLASSTVVYGRSARHVDADTPANADDDRGLSQLRAENAWLAGGDQFHVVRLGGLYGEGRIIGRKALLDGAPVVGNAYAMLNLIHVEDAADLMIAVADSDSAARIELGVDDNPSPRIEYYRYVAKRIGAGDPIALDPDQAQEILGIDAERLRSAPNKRCDNTITKQRTGWSPRFTDFRAGVDHALAAGSTT